MEILAKVTIKRIAEHFNVTSATVSKALHDQPDISEELKDKIRQFAIDNHYVPDYFARGLKGAKAKVVGVVLSDNSNPNYTELLNGIGDVMDKSDFSIILCNSKEDWRKERQHLNVLMQKNVDGILIIPSDTRGEPAPHTRYDILEKNDIPYVLVNRNIQGNESYLVKTDNVRLAYDATTYLFKKGHKKIIHLTNTMDTSTVMDRIEGFKKAHEAASMPFDPNSVRRCDIDYRSCYEYTLRLLQERDDFTAIYVFNDVMAIPVMKAILSTGKKIPQDIAVLGTDNILFANDCIVPLTTMVQNNYRIGQLAAEIIVGLINGTATGIDKTILLDPSGVFERESV